MLEDLKKQVLKANVAVPNYDLETLVQSNVSAINEVPGLVVIKPSDVSYDDMAAKDMDQPFLEKYDLRKHGAAVFYEKSKANG